MNGSLAVTFLMPTIRSGSNSSDRVDQQEGVAMRENLPNRVDVEQWHAVPLL